MTIPFRGLALVLASLVAACAAEPQSPAGATTPREAPEYRTGSNIPIRHPKQQQADERERPAADGRSADKPAN